MKVNEKAKAVGLMAVEMETAGLYLTAMADHKKALSVLSISDHVFSGEHLSPEEIRDSFHEMMEIALKTAVRTAYPSKQAGRPAGNRERSGQREQSRSVRKTEHSRQSERSGGTQEIARVSGQSALAKLQREQNGSTQETRRGGQENEAARWQEEQKIKSRQGREQVKKIGIIGAMEVEVETLKKDMEVGRPGWSFTRAF